ncbi:MAG TPA: mercuric reductase [Stellaceae bacterium]
MTAAFGLASCCALPMALAALGVGSAWLAGIAVTADPHRALLLVASAVGLGTGSVLLWRQRQRVCVPGSICDRPCVRASTFAGILVGAVFLYLG